MGLAKTGPIARLVLGLCEGPSRKQPLPVCLCGRPGRCLPAGAEGRTAEPVPRGIGQCADADQQRDAAAGLPLLGGAEGRDPCAGECIRAFEAGGNGADLAVEVAFLMATDLARDAYHEQLEISLHLSRRRETGAGRIRKWNRRDGATPASAFFAGE